MAIGKKDGIYSRVYEKAKQDDDDLGPLKLLPGKWEGRSTGWNMIALPFQLAPSGSAPFRLLLNQYNERLEFSFVDKGVPNRGLLRPTLHPTEFDQRVVTLDYQQEIKQVAAEDRPDSDGDAGGPGLAIHHEPGLFLYMTNLRTPDILVRETEEIDIARLGSVPHGNAFVAMGAHETLKTAPDIPSVNGLPIGRFEDLSSPAYDFETDPYLEPYRHYIHNPFKKDLIPGFPGFSPSDANAILRFAQQDVIGDVKRTTVLTFDTKRQDGNVVNLPFVVREAEPVSIRSTFWIQETKNEIWMQYSQIIMMDFFRPREDEVPGRAEWPHISINTLRKVDDWTAEL